MPLLVQQTGLALQELPPTPMTEMGLQLTPTRAVMGPRTTPSKPARIPTKGSLACKGRTFVINIETIEQHQSSYSEGLVAALNGTGVAGLRRTSVYVLRCRGEPVFTEPGSELPLPEPDPEPLPLPEEWPPELPPPVLEPLPLPEA